MSPFFTYMKYINNVSGMKIIYNNIFSYLFVVCLVLMPIKILAAENSNQVISSQSNSSAGTENPNSSNTTNNQPKANNTSQVNNQTLPSTGAPSSSPSTSEDTSNKPVANSSASNPTGYRQFSNPNAKVQPSQQQANQASTTSSNTPKVATPNKNNTTSNNINPNSSVNTNTQIENFTANKAKSIVNSIDKNYSFLYDPTMDNSLMVDILQNPQNYVVLFLDQNRQELGTAVLIKVLVNENPAAANSFLSFVRQGLYNNIKIFRLIPNYFLQTGDPSNSGYGGTGILRSASIKKNLKFKRGTVAFSNLNNLKSDDSQFFITFNNFPWLDNKYSIFGTVVYGMDLLEGLRGTYNNDGFVVQGSVIYKAIVLADLQGAGAELFKDYPEAVANAQQNVKAPPLPKTSSTTDVTQHNNSKYTGENN
ncbi:peptidylprolyl isomerase [Candidatus Hepatincola sp. Pdp]